MVTVAGFALLAASPAQAKVAGSATISGPGIGGGDGGEITMGGTDGGGFPMLIGLFDQSSVSSVRPDGRLGPAYQSRYVISQPPDQPRIEQVLYPFAEGGPVVYTPPGQEWFGGLDGTARAGWFRAPAELLDELQARGLPSSAAAATAAAAGGTVAASSPQPASPIPWALGVLAGVLIASAIVARQRAVASA